MLVILPGDNLQFIYTNHRGETRQRHVQFRGMDFGSNEWYLEPQWFLRCIDLERPGVYRSFALAHIDTSTLEKV